VESAVIVIGSNAPLKRMVLSLNLAIAGKIMIQKIVLLKISCHGIRKKQRDLRNRGKLKTEKVVMLKKDLKKNENNFSG